MKNLIKFLSVRVAKLIALSLHIKSCVTNVTYHLIFTFYANKKGKI